MIPLTATAKYTLPPEVEDFCEENSLRYLYLCYGNPSNHE